MNESVDANPVVEQLVEGYKKFHQKYFESADRKLYQDLVEKGQSPKTMVISCSDSRVDPATILNCAPGEIFVIRNVANLVPPCEEDNKHHGTSAALEFAVCFLKVEHIIIFGHTHCGGIQALLSEKAAPASSKRGFIQSWMDIASKAKEQALAEPASSEIQEQRCCEYSLVASLENLKTFPWIVRRIAAGTLELHAWYFDLETGQVKSFNPEKQRFAGLI